MKIRIAQPQNGFSLVELLLTLVLILCLAAASVFTFTALYRTANLDEGYDRFQSLIRFAQAEAATTGRKVRLQFVPARPVSIDSVDSADNSSNNELRNIEVTWEADALNSPGVFQTYTNKTWSEEMVNELVGVEKVQAIQSPNVPATLAPAPALAMNETALDPVLPSDFPSVTFYPDGSCDSAEIVFASRNPEDSRRLEVRLSGILGSVSSRTVSADQVDTGSDAEAQEEYDALFDSSEPSAPGAFDDTSTAAAF